MTSRVGNIRSVLRIASAADLTDAAHVTDVEESVYGGLYQSIECISTLTGLDASARVLEAEHRAQISPLASRHATGIEGSCWPALTAIDYLVTMGQLTQAVIYATEGRSRASVDNLWMRSMSIELPPRPAALPVSFQTTTTLVKDTAIARGGQRIHDVRVASRASTGVSASAALAYMERDR